MFKVVLFKVVLVLVFTDNIWFSSLFWMKSESPRAFSMISKHCECVLVALGVQLRAVVQIPPTKLRIDRTFCVRDTYRFKMGDRCGRTCLAIATFPGKRCDLSQLGQEDGGLLSEMRMGLVGNVCQQGLMEVNCCFLGPHRSSVSVP